MFQWGFEQHVKNITLFFITYVKTFLVREQNMRSEALNVSVSLPRHDMGRGKVYILKHQTVSKRETHVLKQHTTSLNANENSTNAPSLKQYGELPLSCCLVKTFLLVEHLSAMDQGQVRCEDHLPLDLRKNMNVNEENGKNIFG